MKTQKAIVVSGYDDRTTVALNQLLDRGWCVVETCPMPCSNGGQTSSSQYPTCLVIVEKD